MHVPQICLKLLKNDTISAATHVKYFWQSYLFWTVCLQEISQKNHLMMPLFLSSSNEDDVAPYSKSAFK